MHWEIVFVFGEQKFLSALSMRNECVTWVCPISRQLTLYSAVSVGTQIYLCDVRHYTSQFIFSNSTQSMFLSIKKFSSYIFSVVCFGGYSLLPLSLQHLHAHSDLLPHDWAPNTISLHHSFRLFSHVFLEPVGLGFGIL